MLDQLDTLAEAESVFAPQERLDEQAYALWLECCKGAELPAARDVIDHDACTFADSAIIFDVKQCGMEQPRIVYVGDRLPNPPKELPAEFAEISSRSLISRLSDHYLEPIANRAPVGFEAEFLDDGGFAIAYSAIALPCASDGTEIDAVLGFIQFEVLDAPIPTDPSFDTEMSGLSSANHNSNQHKTLEVAFSERHSIEEQRKIIMSYEQRMEECMQIEGALAAALVDMDSGMALSTVGGTKGLDLEVAAAGNTNVLKAKMQTMENLGIKGNLEDMLITLESQIHMLRPATSESGKGLFMYIALDKSKANLAMARHKLRNIEKGLEV